MSLTWTTNGKIWLALHGDQWAKIEHVDDHDCPYHAYIGEIEPCHRSDRVDHEVDTYTWHIANKTFDTLVQAQAWAAEKMGVEK
jgi:hypothetical protein